MLIKTRQDKILNGTSLRFEFAHYKMGIQETRGHMRKAMASALELVSTGAGDPRILVLYSRGT
jgi:hypothetical protein